MIVIGLDYLAGAQGLRMDLERVFGLDDSLSKLRELPRHAGHAICFLFSRMCDAADPGWARQERREGGQSEKRIGDRLEIPIDAPTRISAGKGYVESARVSADLSAHAADDIHKLGVALKSLL